MIGVALVAAALGAEVVKTNPGNGVESVLFEVGGLLQPRFDVAMADGQPSFAIDRARLDLGGTITPERGPLVIRQRLVVELMPEPELLDAWAQVGTPALSLRVGQMKTPLSRQQVASDAKSLVPWGTLASGWITKRDIGAMLAGGLGEKGIFEYQLGAYDGEGRNIPGNGNHDLLLTARAVVSPIGGPGTKTELLNRWAPPDSEPRPTFSFGVAAHRFVLGEDPERVGTIGVNGELFFHHGLFTAQAEYMRRVIDSEAADQPDYQQAGVYAQVGCFLPAGWARDHVAILGRVESGDGFISDDAPIVDDTHPEPDPAMIRETLAIGFYVGEPMFKDAQDARVILGYRAAQEMEGEPKKNDQLSLAANLAF